MKNLYF